MIDPENNTTPDDITASAKEYVNLKIDEYKLKGAEHLAVLSNKMIFLLIATMLGGVILQLMGLALAYFTGELIGDTALGFIIVALFFAIILFVLYTRRAKLFTDKLVILFVKIFFEKEGKQ